MNELYYQAANALIHAKHAIAFTGAGISVESGIPPFRGKNGIWNKYDPDTLDINNFYSQPEASWAVIKEIFYEFFGQSKPNDAHIQLAGLEKINIIKAVITQNIDNLHQEAGSKNVIEFHGNSKKIVCLDCHKTYTSGIIKNNSFPYCPGCKGLLKPGFVFFGEAIPAGASHLSFGHARQADVILVIGTTGEVYPAGQIPLLVKQNGGLVIEINPEASNFTNKVTGIFLQGKATTTLKRLTAQIEKILQNNN